MIKKLVIVGCGVFLLGALLCGREAISYVRTSAGVVKDSVRNSVPVEFQIERARRMIKDLAPEVRKNMHMIAKAEVEVKSLEEQISKAEARLAKEKAELKRLTADVSGGEKVFRYAGRQYTLSQVKTDLARRFDRYRTLDATLGSRREIYDARQRSLDAARAKLEGMLAAKRQLEVDVENLEARLEMLKADQTTNEYSFDDSRLGRVKELVNDLRTRIDVAARLVDAEDHYRGEIPLDDTAPEDIADQVTAYFQEDVPTAEALVAQD